MVAAPSHLHQLGVLASNFTDPKHERTIYIAAVGLAVLGIVLLVATVMWWRGTKGEHTSLAPLEVMGQRSWQKSPYIDRVRRLEGVRVRSDGDPDDLVVHRPEEIDLDDFLRTFQPGFDDLREPPSDAPAAVDASIAAGDDGAPDADSGEVEVVTARVSNATRAKVDPAAGEAADVAANADVDTADAEAAGGRVADAGDALAAVIVADEAPVDAAVVVADDALADEADVVAANDDDDNAVTDDLADDAVVVVADDALADSSANPDLADDDDNAVTDDLADDAVVVVADDALADSSANPDLADDGDNAVTGDRAANVSAANEGLANDGLANDGLANDGLANDGLANDDNAVTGDLAADVSAANEGLANDGLANDDAVDERTGDDVVGEGLAGVVTAGERGSDDLAAEWSDDDLGGAAIAGADPVTDEDGGHPDEEQPVHVGAEPDHAAAEADGPPSAVVDTPRVIDPLLAGRQLDN